MKFRSNIQITAVLAAVTLLGSLGGCNIYSPFDHASSDPQLLSAARAYFDQGEFDKAAEMYAKLSGDKADDMNADSAFQILDQNGASMSEFMIAFGTGGGSMGKAFTKFADHLTTSGGPAGVTKRLALLSAFQKVAGINDPATRGMVRFTTAAAMIAELLAEDAGSDDAYNQADLVATPATCLTKAIPASCNDPSCDKPAGKTLDRGTQLNNLPVSGTTGMTGAPTFWMLAAALQEINTALGSEIQSSGQLGSKLTSFLTTLIAGFRAQLLLGNAAGDRCSRYSLLANDIGTL